MSEPTVEQLKERIAQLESEARINTQLPQALEEGVLPVAIPDLRDRAIREKPSDFRAWVVALRENGKAPHYFGSNVAMPGSIGGGVRSVSSPAGSASGSQRLNLSEIAQIKDERERAKQLQALMEAERSRGRAR